MIKDALKYLEPNACVPIDMETTIMLVNALKEALAQPEQEPVAWMDADGNVSDNNDHKCFPIPLYTTPPQRTWVGLTLEQYIAINCSCTTVDQAVGSTERQLKENNT
jgi:hypothetical protein